MNFELITNDILIPSILSGILVAGFIFFLGLAIMWCLKLFNS